MCQLHSGGKGGPVTCTCASLGVQEVVVWTAFTSTCHFLHPFFRRKITENNRAVIPSEVVRLEPYPHNFSNLGTFPRISANND